MATPEWAAQALALKISGHHDQAAAIYRREMSSGNVAASIALARMGAMAELTATEVDRLIARAEQSMNQDDIEAHLEMSRAYDQRLGDLPYEEKAARGFKHLIAAGKLGAGPMHSLAIARIYLQGAIGIERDHAESVRWFEKAIDQGSAEAEAELTRLLGKI